MKRLRHPGAGSLLTELGIFLAIFMVLLLLLVGLIRVLGGSFGLDFGDSWRLALIALVFVVPGIMNIHEFASRSRHARYRSLPLIAAIGEFMAALACLVPMFTTFKNPAIVIWGLGIGFVLVFGTPLFANLLDRRASQRGLDFRKPVAAADTTPRRTQSTRGWVTPGPAESQQGGLRVSVRERNGIVVLDLTAGPDVLDWGNFENQLNELLRDSRKSIIVHLGNVTRIYALGVAALAQAFDRARVEGAVIKLSNPSKGVRQALELTGITASVEIYEDEDKAVASFENNRELHAPQLVMARADMKVVRESADKIKHELQAAREELSVAAAALAPKHKGGEQERFRAAHDHCISLERELARATGDECAVEIEWPVQWDVGAPLPHVVSSGSRTYLIYLVSEPDPNWDGSYVTMIDPTFSEKRSIAVVEFESCLVYKFGAPNDEALAGHPLHGRGLVGYRAHTVERSRWIGEHEKINSVHPLHKPGWEKLFTHYVLAFHDETFECIARNHYVNTVALTFAEALEQCVREVVS
jgi:anti-anti-sigma factor